MTNKCKKRPPCIAPSRVTQKIFAVLVDWVHVVLTPSFKLVSFYIYICCFTVVSIRHCVTCKLTYNNFVFKFPNFRYRGNGDWFRQISFTPIFVHELRVITVPIDYHWKCVRVHCACSESHDSCIGDQKQLHFWNPRPRFAYSLCNFRGSTMKVIKVVCENNALPCDKRRMSFCACAKSRDLLKVT